MEKWSHCARKGEVGMCVKYKEGQIFFILYGQKEGGTTPTFGL